MKITQLNISEFGRLKNTQITLSDGINIIGGDNESGKSTVMLFIRFMFYGLPKKSQKNNMRERSLSFESHRAAGSMLISKDGREYRIERTVTGTTRPNETLKIFDMQSGELIFGEPWELFLGVAADVFESSCAVHQAKASGIDKASAGRALENILASADESIDVSSALDAIDKVRREYKLNRGEGGILYETGREIAELESKKARATEKQLEINRLSSNLAKLEEDLRAAVTDKETAEIALDIAKKAQILARFDALGQKQRDKEALEDELIALQQQFPYKNIAPTAQTAADVENAAQSLRLARQKLEARKDEHQALIKKAGTNFPLSDKGGEIQAEGGAKAILAKANAAKKHSKLLTGFGLAAIIAAVACVTVSLKYLIFIGATAILAILAVILFVSSAKKRTEVKKICERYAQSFDTLGDYLEKCSNDFTALQSTSHEITVAAAKLEAAEQDLSAAQNALATLVFDANASTEELISSSAKICADIRALCAAKNELNLKIAACDALISSNVTALAEYDEMTLRAELYEKLDTAMDVSAAERALAFAISKKDSITRNIGVVRENLAASRGSVGQDPLTLGDKISALKEQLAARTRYFDALMLAKDTIERASDALSGNVTPEISRKASEIMELVSGGRHPALRTTKQLELSVDEDGFGYSADLLSEGARDAAYIALRISLMLRIFGDQLPPLMLDDALCQFDDSRASVMIGLIAKLSELPLQSIIFTCHSREVSICEQKGIPHTYTRLN